jgi:Flp pilus assembly protein CpaB
MPNRDDLRLHLARRRRAVRRVVLARRRPLAALLAAGAVLAGVHEVRPPPSPSVPVPTAARDLPSGTVIAGDDIITVDYADGTEPAGLVDDAVGRVLAAPLRAGEPLTDVRLVGPDLAQAYPGSVLVPVRLPDAEVAGLLRVGDRIDLLSADPQGAAAARLVATDLTVAALPRVAEGLADSTLPGRVVVLAAPQAVTEEMAQAAVTGFLTFTYAR